MSESQSGPASTRPRQATLAGWVIVGASVAVVLSVFSQVSALGSLDTTRTIEEALGQPPGNGLGIDVETARTALRVLGTIAAVCAAVTAVLGWQALQRSRGARIGLSVLALPLLVTGVVSGGVMSSVVAAGAIVLWMQPSRDWFAGREPASARDGADSTTPSRPVWPPPPPVSSPVSPPVPAVPEPGPAPSTPVSPPAAPPPYAGPYAGASYGAPPGAPGPRAARPVPLVWACVLTWLGCGVVVAVLGLSLAVLLTSPDSVLDEVARTNPELVDQGLTTQAVRAAAVVMVAVVVTWALAAAALAALAWRGLAWAHILLIVSAGVAAVLCLPGLLVNPLLGVPLLACIGTAVLMLRGEVRAWVQARSLPGPG